MTGADIFAATGLGAMGDAEVVALAAGDETAAEPSCISPNTAPTPTFPPC